MKIQLNTDNHIEGRDRMEAYFSDAISLKFKRFEDHITSLELFLGDENSSKSGTDDKRCTIEARLIGKNPTAVTAHSDTVEKAITAAVDKMKKVLETVFDKERQY